MNARAGQDLACLTADRDGSQAFFEVTAVDAELFGGERLDQGLAFFVEGALIDEDLGQGLFFVVSPDAEVRIPERSDRSGQSEKRVSRTEHFVRHRTRP